MCHLTACNLTQLSCDLACALIRRQISVTAIQERKVWKLLLVNHMDATIKHDCSAANFSDNARATDILSSS